MKKKEKLHRSSSGWSSQGELLTVLLFGVLKFRDISRWLWSVAVTVVCITPTVLQETKKIYTCCVNGQVIVAALKVEKVSVRRREPRPEVKPFVRSGVSRNPAEFDGS